MSHTHVIRALGGVKVRLSRLLTPASQEVLDDAVRQVRDSHDRYETWKLRTHHTGAGQTDWGFEIGPRRPLRFVRADHIKGLLPEADIYGMMRWTSDDDRPDVACFVLRIWSASDAFFYREDWDADRFCDIIAAPDCELGGLERRRVLVRLHFDLRDHDAQHSEPLYHLHIGGQAQGDELCWFPESVDSPRIPFVPVDLVLACEMVVADLFAQSYTDLSRDPSWRYLLHESHARTLKPYLEECLHAISEKWSWLEHLHQTEYRHNGG